jgi:lipopolysaccharide/colanic/teichoic acid biosynthesis glycosyltransferase
VAIWSEIGAATPGFERSDVGGRVWVSQHGLPLEMSGGTPVLPSSPPSRFHAAGKRLLDVTLSAMALVGLAPVLVGLAVAIKLSSPGPILFRQTRHGKDGVPFELYKFRSLSTKVGDPSGVQQVLPADPRVTRVGRFIRATSLDELPQLFNILRGDMSIIGPRPHAIGMLAGGLPYEVLVPYYHKRHAVKPGLSGWAQVNGLRGPTVDPVLARERIDHDIAYIQNQTLPLDIKIVLLTLQRQFLTGSGT